MPPSLPARSITVETGSRLHFGLLSGGQPGRQFGGIGCMIDPPRLQLGIEPADSFSTSGPLSERVTHFALQWAKWRGESILPLVKIRIEKIPGQHTGLGVGTQLGLAIAAGLQRAHAGAPMTAEDLAIGIGRAKRSAVGTYGFLHGGFIVDQGKYQEEPLGQLGMRIAMPTAWRFLLIKTSEAPGVAGAAESEAFSKLPAGSKESLEAMQKLIEEELVPSLKEEAFARFSEALCQYGVAAGECFSALQGGIYALPQTAQLADYLQSLGVKGVGQSSWGPTLFALCEDEANAVQLIKQLRTVDDFSSMPMDIARPRNTGALITDAR